MYLTTDDFKGLLENNFCDKQIAVVKQEENLDIYETDNLNFCEFREYICKNLKILDMLISNVDNLYMRRLKGERIFTLCCCIISTVALPLLLHSLRFWGLVIEFVLIISLLILLLVIRSGSYLEELIRNQQTYMEYKSLCLKILNLIS